MTPQIVIGGACLILAGLWLLGLWLGKKPVQTGKVASVVDAHKQIVELIASAPNAAVISHLKEAGKALYDAEAVK